MVPPQFATVIPAGDFTNATRGSDFAGRKYADAHGFANEIGGQTIDDQFQRSAGFGKDLRL